MSHCRRCGRPEDRWDEAGGEYCSEACRDRPLDEVDRELEDAIRRLTRQRGPDKTICPSEAAKGVDPEGWRDLMDRTRLAAARLRADEEVDITRGGEPVDPWEPGGPIRIGKRRG